MKGRLWADTGAAGQHRRTDAQPDLYRASRTDVPYRRARLGSMPAVTGRHIQSSLFLRRHDTRHAHSRRARAADLLLHEQLRHPRAPLSRTAVFLLLCSLRCLTDSGLYQLTARTPPPEASFPLRLYDHGHPDGAFRPQHGKRQTAHRSRYDASRCSASTRSRRARRTGFSACRSSICCR